MAAIIQIQDLKTKYTKFCANLHFVQYNETSDQYQLKQHVVTKDYDQIKTCMTRFENFKNLKLLWFN